MVDDFGENLMHNKERNLRKGGLNMAAFNRRMKFVNVYDQCTRVHCRRPSYFAFHACCRPMTES